MYRLVKERFWYEIFITDWSRTAEEQNALYQQWRTKPWKIVTYVDGYKVLSEHQSWISFDIAFRGWELYPKDHQMREDVATVGREVWLARGYDRWNRDKPHRSNLEDEPEITFIEKVRRKMQVDFDFNVYQEAEDKYWIDKHLNFCISWAETSYWKSLKSKSNLSNIGNRDNWDTKDFDSFEDNVMETARILHESPYLWKWSIIGELSCDGREQLGWSECKPTQEDYFRASDSTWNRINNVSKCMTDMLWEDDYLNYNYKL